VTASVVRYRRGNSAVRDLLKNPGLFKYDHGAEGEAGRRGAYLGVRAHRTASLTEPGEVFQPSRTYVLRLDTGSPVV